MFQSFNVCQLCDVFTASTDKNKNKQLIIIPRQITFISINNFVGQVTKNETQKDKKSQRNYAMSGATRETSTGRKAKGETLLICIFSKNLVVEGT